MRRIIDAADLSAGDLVLEVGPGTGALSVRILECGAHLVAVEIDNGLAPILDKVLQRFGDKAHLLYCDVLAGKHQINPDVINALGSTTFDGNADARHELRPFKLVANLPYNIASPLLANLLTTCPQMTRAVATVQREVADRLTGRPRSRDYGPLSVMVQAMSEVSTVQAIPASCFWPTPQVDSTVVQLERRSSPLTNRPDALRHTVQMLFTHRRKQLRSILKKYALDTPWPEGIDPTVRPEQLTVEQLVNLSRTLG